MATKNDQTEISTIEIKMARVTYCVLGTTPIILNRLAEKARHQLLMPSGRKTSAEKATNLKHNPFDEFRSSPYVIRDESSDTLLAHLSTAFKKAIASTALDIPGAKKAQLSRLMWVEGEKVPIYGIPKLHMAITRSADMAKTPDVRTRCTVPKWATKVTVAFPVPILKDTVVTNLFSAAGMIQGVGDWRPEKGSGTYGQFELVSENDPRFIEIVKNGGRLQQIKAMEEAEPYDEETSELLAWFVDEADKRGFKGLDQ
jgi:hypothetical protein